LKLVITRFWFVLLCASAAMPTLALAQTQRPSTSTSLDAELRAELVRIDARLRELDAQRSRNGIALPIALTAGNFAVGVAFGLSTALYTFITVTNANEAHDHVSDHELRTRRWLGAVSLLGLSGGVVSAAWLGRRVRARRALAPERRALLAKRHELESALGLKVGPQSLGLTLNMSF
jgi:hypothetical protein